MSQKASHRTLPKLVGIVALTAAVIAIPAYYALVAVPKQQQSLRKYELMKAGLQYHEFYDVNSRPPANLDEFMKYEPEGPYARNQPRDLMKFADKVRSGEITVLWGSRLLDSGWEGDQHLLAYESVASKAGGFVLMGGGSVKQVTAKDFAMLPKLPTSEAD